jgi:hypothetical protein
MTVFQVWHYFCSDKSLHPKYVWCMVCRGQHVNGVYTRNPEKLEDARGKGPDFFADMPKAMQSAHPFLFSSASGVFTLKAHLKSQHKITQPSKAPTPDRQPTPQQIQPQLLMRPVANPVRFLLPFVLFLFVSARSFHCPCCS